MRTVIKLAGALLEDDATVRALARQIARLAQQGHEILVVHGGGRLFTATLQRMGIESNFVAGLRVTDRETRDVAVMVFAGLLNKRLASAISAEGCTAIGISAADAACFRAEPMVHNEIEGRLGFVGYLTGLNTGFIESLWREGMLPVAPCLGLGQDNELYRSSRRRKSSFRGHLRRNRAPRAVPHRLRRHGLEARSRQARPRRRRPRSPHRRRRLARFPAPRFASGFLPGRRN